MSVGLMLITLNRLGVEARGHKKLIMLTWCVQHSATVKYSQGPVWDELRDEFSVWVCPVHVHHSSMKR